MPQELEKKKMYVEKTIETQKSSLAKYKAMLDEALINNEARKIEVYSNRVENINKRIINLQNQLMYMREDIPNDLKERKNIQQTFSKEIAEVIPNGVPMVFHGNNDIATIYEIIKSGGLKTPEERGVEFKSFATQIDVANKHDIHVPVEFAEPGYESCRPYGAIFAFYPKEEELDKGLGNFGLEVPGGVQSIDFKEDDSRFVAVITTQENKARIQEWLKEFEMDVKKVFTHSEFIQMCKEKFKTKHNINGQELGKQVVDEISDTVLSDETEKNIIAQQKQIENQMDSQDQVLQ